MDKYPNFNFIDVAFGGTHNRNNLIKKWELAEYARRWKEQFKKPYVDCYRTYWLYPDAMLEHFSKKKSVSQYEGYVYSEFLPIDDVDSSDLIQSLQNTRVILHHLEKNYDVDLKVIRIYFSGAKGFHVELASGLFGFEASQFLNGMFKAIVFRLLPEGIPIDSAVYDKVRLWRLPNTINSKSGLYKVPLSLDELFNLTIPEIQDLAKTQRKGVFSDSNVTLNPSLNRLYMEVKEEVLKRSSEPKSKDEKRDYEKLFADQPINEKEGSNNALFGYGCKLRAKGVAFDDIALILNGLNATRCNPPLDEEEA